MTTLYYKRHGIRYAQVWFNEGALEEVDKGVADIVEFKESYAALPLLYPFVNGVIDLSIGLEEIFERFDKGFKYEVRRAEKENIVCEPAELNDSSLLDIFKRFSEFSVKKNSPILPFDFFVRYQKEGKLRITIAKLEGQIIQYHIYFNDASEFLLLASFPGEEIQKKSLVGFANRLLHWRDIQDAFQAGKKKYNLGGMGNSGAEQTKGIGRFKLEMSPALISYFQGSVAITMKGKIYSKIRKWLTA